VGDGHDSDGSFVGKPRELAQAELILGLCERFGCLPSALLQEDATILRMLKVESMGRKGEGVGDG
jgi:hypothetical protein